MTFHQNTNRKHNILVSIWISALLLICLLIYWPGLHGPFLLDDNHHLEALNNHGGVTSFYAVRDYVFGQSSGPTGRPVAMLSFLINDQYWPSLPSVYKYTNLLIHMLCGLTLIYLILRICRTLHTPEHTSQYIALFAGTVWLLHPFNVSTTLYVVQRMTQLMTLFSIIGIICYIYAREKIRQRPIYALSILTSTLIIFGGLATLSKENGALIVFYIALIEFTLFSKQSRPILLKAWLIIFIGVPIFIFLSYFVISWDKILESYSSRTFTLNERLLTEARIIFIYLLHILSPRNSGTGLFHDDIEISTGILSPITTLLSLGGILLLIVLAVASRKSRKIITLGIAWFFIGHILESTVLPLELYFEHRNYFPMVGPIFTACYYTQLYLVNSKSNTVKLTGSLAIITWISLFALLTFQTSVTWNNPNTLFSTWATEHPRSIRSQILFAKQLENDGQSLDAIYVLSKIYNTYPNDIGLPLQIIAMSCKNDIAPLVSLEMTVNDLDRAKNRGSFLKPIEDVINLYADKSCDNINIDMLHKYLDKLPTIPTLKTKKKELARIYFLHADLHILERDLDSAMTLLDKAYIHQKTVDIPLKQTILLMSAGLYNDALVYLNIARIADKNRHPLKPSREKELTAVEDAILSQRDFHE